MRLSVLLLLLFPGVLPAASLHKCLGTDGVASYQSLPCAPGQRTAWTREAPPLSEPGTARASKAAAPAAATAPPRPGPRPIASRPRADPSASRCAAARRAADLTRDRLWNRLSFRQRSDLDARVARACTRR